ALAKKKLSMKAASLAAGQGETFVRDILARDREPSLEKFTALAYALGTTVGAMVDDEGSDKVVPSNAGELPVIVAGKTAAGVFREVEDFDQSAPERVWEPLDPRFPNARRMAFDVEGDSMNNLKPRPIME